MDSHRAREVTVSKHFLNCRRYSKLKSAHFYDTAHSGNYEILEDEAFFLWMVICRSSTGEPALHLKGFTSPFQLLPTLTALCFAHCCSVTPIASCVRVVCMLININQIQNRNYRRALFCYRKSLCLLCVCMCIYIYEVNDSGYIDGDSL